jgi:hypothetical protein
MIHSASTLLVDRFAENNCIRHGSANIQPSSWEWLKLNTITSALASFMLFAISHPSRCQLHSTLDLVVGNEGNLEGGGRFQGVRVPAMVL